MSGKSYNRCKRIHGLLATALEYLHFEAFLDQIENKDEVLLQLISDLDGVRSTKSGDKITFGDLELSQETEETKLAYAQYSKDTADGKHGKTAQYWFGYVKLVKLYRMFSRALREGDFELYKYCLNSLIPFFFAFNHPNYCRWLIRFLDSLMRLDQTHPLLYRDFCKGLFAIRRTKKPFSGSPIDLTLEQTVNGDAASEKLGITHLTNSISARQKWSLSHSLRITIVSDLLEKLLITKKEDVTGELKPCRVKRDNADLKNIKEGIIDTMNPFNKEVNPEYIFNLGSGKAASNATADFLLNCQQIGECAQENFIKECIQRPTRFEEKIARQKTSTFATELKKRKITNKDKKIQAVEMVRDVFGCILHLALEKKVHMEIALQFPLTPVPLSLSHADGTMLSTPKSKLLNQLEPLSGTLNPTNVNVTIIDAMFLLHLMPTSLPATFGSVAEHILRTICKFQGSIIHFVSDKTISPSIKDAERESRSSDSRASAFSISGPCQKRPPKWLNALRNDNFKNSLIEFLVNAWSSKNEYSTIIGDKVLYANVGDMCYSIRVLNGIVSKRVEPLLFSTHEEADSRMLFHMTASDSKGEIVIRSNDTDVLVALLGCYDTYKENVTGVWMEMGVFSTNTLRYVDVSKLYEELGPLFCKSLPGLHALTGSDYTSAFSRKGKIRPFALLQKNINAQRALSNLGTTEHVPAEIQDEIEKFVCQLYGHKGFTSIDEVRLHMFLKKYKCKGNVVASTAKKMDGSSLPPCKKVLKEKIKRTNFVVAKWMSATKSSMPPFDPINCGWELLEGQYKLHWFEGNASPTILEVSISEVSEEEEYEEDENEDDLVNEDVDSDSDEDDE